MSEHEKDPEGLTSPGTADDPELEQRRARDAAKREAESRDSDETKFEQQRREQQAEREEAARTLDDVPPERDD